MYFSYATKKKRIFSCILISRSNKKNHFSRHFNFAVFRPRPRNREIFMPRNFHAIKYSPSLQINSSILIPWILISSINFVNAHTCLDLAWSCKRYVERLASFSNNSRIGIVDGFCAEIDFKSKWLSNMKLKEKKTKVKTKTKER